MPVKEGNIIRRTRDVSVPPVISEEQKQRLKSVAVMPDDQIDYSDAPHLPDAVWVKASALPETKRQVTLRIDADVLDFFQGAGKRYQTRINAVLRSYVEAHKAHAK